jgi:diguanylate cyclase (GGDEF)-like protein
VFASLASRIGFFVFAATLASAIAVAFTSALAVRDFLRSRVEEHIPEAAASARDRLELWYAQRALDLQIFSHSEIVVSRLTALARPRAESRAASRAEVEEYLRYVRERLPVYATIFALDARGDVIARAGEPLSLAAAVRRELAKASEPRVSGLFAAQTGEEVQVVSAPVAADGRTSVSLHAVIPIRTLRGLLASPHGDGRVHVYDDAGRLVASTIDGYRGELPEALARTQPGRVVDYATPDGLRVVASFQPIESPRLRLVYEGDYGATFAPIASILARTVGLNLGIVLVLAGAAFAIARYLLRPLHTLSEAALRLRDGATDVRIPVVSADHEVGVLARSFAQMVESLTAARETLEQLAITDGLTKIHNHRYFQEQLESAIRGVENTGAPVALVLLDIDDFKQLNDTHGHTSGDRVLAELAQLLTMHARPRDVVARYGGEEFVVLALGLSLEDAVALAEQIRLSVAAHAFRAPASGERLPVTVSIGVAAYRGDRARFFADADRALYAAKHGGKDCVVAAEG